MGRAEGIAFPFDSESPGTATSWHPQCILGVLPTNNGGRAAPFLCMTSRQSAGHSVVITSYLATTQAAFPTCCPQLTSSNHPLVDAHDCTIVPTMASTVSSALGNAAPLKAGIRLAQAVQSTGIKALLKLSSSETHRQKLMNRAQVLDSCSTYDYETSWKEIRKAGNATLFQRVPEYGQWKTRQYSSTLLISGKLESVRKLGS